MFEAVLIGLLTHLAVMGIHELFRRLSDARVVAMA